jgi:hypothetical protein
MYVGSLSRIMGRLRSRRHIAIIADRRTKFMIFGAHVVVNQQGSNG